MKSYLLQYSWDFPDGSDRDGKESAAMQETQVWSLVQKIPWRREQLPTPVFLHGEFYRQRVLVGYSCKEWDTTEQHFHFLTSISYISFVIS